MAYAETQSMFCDSLLQDADWLKRYAKNAAGEPIPDSLIHDMIATDQPMRAFNERQIALVAYFERDLYALAESELTPNASWVWPANMKCAFSVSKVRVRCWPFRTCLTRSQPVPTTATCWH